MNRARPGFWIGAALAVLLSATRPAATALAAMTPASNARHVRNRMSAGVPSVRGVESLARTVDSAHGVHGVRRTRPMSRPGAPVGGPETQPRPGDLPVR